MIEQTSSIVISIGARSCALRFGAVTAPKLVGMVSLPADQTIVLGHSRSCDASHTKDGTTPAPLPAAVVLSKNRKPAMRDGEQLRAGSVFKIAPTVRLLLLKSFGQRPTEQTCRGR